MFMKTRNCINFKQFDEKGGKYQTSRYIYFPHEARAKWNAISSDNAYSHMIEMTAD